MKKTSRNLMNRLICYIKTYINCLSVNNIKLLIFAQNILKFIIKKLFSDGFNYPSSSGKILSSSFFSLFLGHTWKTSSGSPSTEPSCQGSTSLFTLHSSLFTLDSDSSPFLAPRSDELGLRTTHNTTESIHR